MTTWHQDSVVVSRDDAIMGMPLRPSSRKAAHTTNDAMKLLFQAEGGGCNSWVDSAPKRQAVGSPQAAKSDSTDIVYVLGSETETQDDDMCVVFYDEGLGPGPSNRISTNDWDEEQHTSLGMCTAT